LRVDGWIVRVQVVYRPLCLFVFGKMGSTSWHDNILQALLIGLVVQIVVSILWVFRAFLRASWKERMASPAAGYTSRLPCQINSLVLNLVACILKLSAILDVL